MKWSMLPCIYRPFLIRSGFGWSVTSWEPNSTSPSRRAWKCTVRLWFWSGTFSPGITLIWKGDGFKAFCKIVKGKNTNKTGRFACNLLCVLDLPGKVCPSWPMRMDSSVLSVVRHRPGPSVRFWKSCMTCTTLRSCRCGVFFFILTAGLLFRASHKWGLEDFSYSLTSSFYAQGVHFVRVYLDNNKEIRIRAIHSYSFLLPHVSPVVKTFA